ncbi:nuclear transport factor 2 family protein [Pedobacter insulae]|uniref:Ketosteroid isomerase-related protein n=1 Tax=Pedobacter insulae TaxID=414048 RepID=A0A1I2YTD9_9SPHI|nr:nuclear transport factor 2 family protein [Pedobacter insulae]SFH28745.1 Ketosteroid isomerase-related protein [Pedobacter insulae]
MSTNEQLINHFYTCFKNRDFKGMQECYADNAIFNDAIFKNLNADEVKAMWEMLIVKGKDMSLAYQIISAVDNKVSAHWDAHYTFSATGKKVVNRIDATFEIADGKIVKHTDDFSFFTWSRQALGLPGILLGWTSFLNKKISTQARRNLESFMQHKH